MNYGLVFAVFAIVGTHLGLWQAQTADLPMLPQPAGAFGVGRVAYDWTDTTRPDPFSTQHDRHRELMVYVWYPTSPEHTLVGGVYQPGAKQIDAAPGSNRMRASPIWPLIVADKIASHARNGAAVAVRSQRFPLVLFSHGDGASGFAYTSAIEDLVSHGYVVAALEHPYSSAAVVFSDGRIVQFSDRRILTGDRPTGVPYFEGVQAAMDDMRRLADIQASDVLFVLRQLRSRDADKAWLLHGHIDFGHVAAVGHSLGGVTAVRRVSARCTDRCVCK